MSIINLDSLTTNVYTLVSSSLSLKYLMNNKEIKII